MPYGGYLSCRQCSLVDLTPFSSDLRSSPLPYHLYRTTFSNLLEARNSQGQGERSEYINPMGTRFEVVTNHSPRCARSSQNDHKITGTVIG